jgi:ABC-type uncharacterized transport system permease subunit
MNAALICLRAALALYALGFGTALYALIAEKTRPLAFTPWVAGLGWLCHTAALLFLGWSLKRCPLATLPEVLSALAWASVLVYLVVSLRTTITVLHIIVLPLSMIVLVLSKVLPGTMLPVAEPLRASVLRFHLTAIILGVAALTVTFAASVAYVVADRALKSKRPGRYFQMLPSLEGCDRLGRRSLLLAFPLLTLGIVTGAIANENLTGTAWTWQPRETLAVLSWVLLGIVVVARVGWGWRGRKAALLTILGFSLVFLRMLGV